MMVMAEWGTCQTLTLQLCLSTVWLCHEYLVLCRKTCFESFPLGRISCGFYFYVYIFVRQFFAPAEIKFKVRRENTLFWVFSIRRSSHFIGSDIHLTPTNSQLFFWIELSTVRRHGIDNNTIGLRGLCSRYGSTKLLTLQHCYVYRKEILSQ